MSRSDPPRYYVMYRLANVSCALVDGSAFDLRRDALDHRNWFFGHSPGVVSCWIEKDDKPTGAVLERDAK